MQKLRNLVIATLLLAGSLFAFQTMALAQVDCTNPTTAQEAIQCGSDEAAGQTGSSQNAEATLDRTVKRVVNIISVIVALVAIVMIIYAGFRYITSSGDSNRITGAKNTLLYAVIGLVIVALAQSLTRFVLFQTTSNTGGTNTTSPPAPPTPQPSVPPGGRPF